MSPENNNPNVNQGAVATAPGDPSAGPEAVMAQLRALRNLIPEYTQLPGHERRPLVVVASVDPEFVRASIHSVAESANVQQALGRTPEELQQETIDAHAWASVEDELRALLDGVTAANLVRRNRIGESALAVYAIARRLARQKQHADLLPHVETMKRLNRFGVKGGKAAPQAPAPAPAPAPVEEPKPTTAG
jgi:hypothetical protein